MDPIQVVAGALYKFTLQLEHTQSKECAIRDETEECKVLFLCIVVVWRGFQFLYFYFFARWSSGRKSGRTSRRFSGTRPPASEISKTAQSEYSVI